jgi:hypothetical protein
MKLLKLGPIALDGTKVHANASRHHALSYQRANDIQAQFRREVTRDSGPRRAHGCPAAERRQ